MGGEDRVGRRFGLGGRRLAGTAADGGVPEELRELALDQPRGLGCQLDVAPHDLDQRIDIDVHRQRRRGDALRGFGGLAGGLHVSEFNRVTRNTRSSRNSEPGWRWT